MIVPAAVRTAAQAAARLRDGADASWRVALDVGGCRVDVLTNERRLQERLATYFRDHLTARGDEPHFRIVAVEGPTAHVELELTEKSPDPGKARVKEEYVDFADGRFVRKRLTGMVFVFGGDLHVAYGPCVANDNQIVNFINNRYMQWRLQQRCLLCHAGAVARDGRALALCGPSGAGKSTISLGLVARGLDFVSNDRVLIDARNGDLELQGIPKHPRVNPGTLLHNPMLRSLLEPEERARFLAMPPEALLVLEQKHDVLIDRIAGVGRFKLRAMLDALVIIAWNGAGPARVEPVDLGARSDLLPHVMKSPGLFYEPEADEPRTDLSPRTYVEVLSRRPVFEITGTRDFLAAEDLCMGLLDGGVSA